MSDLLIIAALIALSALFSAAEFALVRVRRSRIEQLIEEGNTAARRVRRLVSRPDRFLAVIQIGVTFIAVLAGAFAGASVIGELERVLAGSALLAPHAGWIALLVVTGLISIASIIFGELVPKTIALAHASAWRCSSRRRSTCSGACSRRWSGCSAALRARSPACSASAARTRTG